MKNIQKNTVLAVVAAMLLVVAGTGLAIAEDSITGTIAEKGNVMVLDSADGVFILEGSNLTADMVGQKVNVTGTVAEKDGVKVISVLAMEPLTE
ncbi:DUF5818 domain-containing protein [Desulfosarcina sp.]|uniref:DUF5818 domain-containing protein n=1 Tax=Desulfosarcina sp. TaxID=2027861 RepID=UPI0029B2E941|nr:DUF5818 domain-containing protein [Desulfosarcina sp.]MDX2452854.1 DUF5818 domain-containing protein [Desulfosarcina sp.]MDX2490598.1 DUF5818 domain-containing protein [Desulfosarcina sp.]